MTTQYSFCFLPLIAGLACMVGVCEAKANDRLVLLDGQAIEGTIESIDENGAISGEKISANVEIDGLRRIETPVAIEPAESDILAEVSGGGQISLSKFIIDDQQRCHLHNGVLGELTLPIDAMRSVRFVGGKPEATFVEGTQEKRDEDRVFVKLGGGLEPIDGLIESADEFKIVIDPGSGLRTIARDKIYGIVFAMVGREPNHSGEALVTVADGSQLWGKIGSLSDGKLNLVTAGNTKVAIPWAKVGRMQVRSTRMVFLSDLEPVEARHQPLVTLQRPHQMDASVAGNPLRIAGKSFDKGIGVASRSVLVFENEGNFALFAATIGIDEETEARGDCEFVVEVDGREQLRQRMTGKSAPQKIAVDVKDGSRVTLIVEAGEDLDLSDHANWCDARFVKE